MTGFACDVFYFVLGDGFLVDGDLFVALLAGYFSMSAVQLEGGDVVVEFLDRPLIHAMAAFAFALVVNGKLPVMIIDMTMTAIG